MLRVTGRVLRVDYKSGAKADASTGELRPWAFHVVKILVADMDLAEVTIFGDSPYVGSAVVGAEVDWAVSVAARGGRLNVQLDKPWAELFPPVAEGAHRSKAAA